MKLKVAHSAILSRNPHFCFLMSDYRVAANDYGECKESDGARITTEAECKQACNSLKIKSMYQVGQWGHSPGCSYYGGNRGCQWNTRTDVLWSTANHFAVCRHNLINGTL